MKVRELVEKLKQMDQEAIVVYTNDVNEEERYVIGDVVELKSYNTSGHREYFSAPVGDPQEAPDEVEVSTAVIITTI